MKNINRNMLHMKLNSAVSVLAVAAAFAVFLPPSNALAGVCFLPDCMDEDVVQGDINMNINSDTEYCEEKGYTYYSSGECPQYQAKVGTCSRDDHYLKCDAVTWCKNNGYNTQTCSLPSFVNDQCPNGKPYYKGCKEDRPRACREQGYVNSCSPGRLYATSNRCPWDNSYGKCCTASPSTGCPSSYKVTCDPSRGSSGVDTCGYTCYRCCSDECTRGSKNYTGSYAMTTECGSTCRYCKDCTRGSTSYSGSYAGTSECGTCYNCNDNCSRGKKSVSCSSTEKRVRVTSTECGTSCYECQYNSDCSVTSKTCNYGCAYTNSCGKCTRCEDKPACSPLRDESCPGATESCSDGCGGTRKCCKKGSGGTPVGSTTGRIWFEPTNKPICWTVPTRDCSSSKPYSIVQDVHEWCDCGGGIHEFDRGIHSGYLSRTSSRACFATKAECDANKSTYFEPKSNAYLQGNAYNGSANCSCK